jgi:protein-tyrosine phosphatase
LKKNHNTAEVDSCGFESFHIGDAPDARAQAIAKKHGIDISAHQARLFTIKDFDRFDQIYIMDVSHYQRVMHLSRNVNDRQKIDFIMNQAFPGSNLNVQDPWYSDISAFEKVYQQLELACEIIASRLKEKPGKT